MKRRNVDISKVRRPPLKQQRARVADGLYQSIITYMKILTVWAFVLMIDFFVEFRFEYLWPFWLLLRSFYDSFKYQGLAFSMFFLCITITSDIVCYLFVPVQFLFFTASTYVWVQHVWQTDRGFCLPTCLLCLIFLYVEAFVRLKELKNMSFSLDLCRPFAAHCVGYPVITMGFSIRSSISHRFRLRKQKEVQKENQFYMQLLEQALPPPLSLEEDRSKESTSPVAAHSMSPNNHVSSSPSSSSTSLTTSSPSSSSLSSSLLASLWSSVCSLFATPTPPVKKDPPSKKSKEHQHGQLGNNNNGGGTQPQDALDREDLEFCEQQSHVSDYDDVADGEASNFSLSTSNGVIKSVAKPPKKTKSINASSSSTTGAGNSAYSASNLNANSNRDSVVSRLEAEVKRMRSELQVSRNLESELRSQISNLSATDKLARSELNQLRLDNENLQSKLHKQMTGRQQDKQTLALVERRLVEERKQKVTLENQLTTEKRRKAEETAAAALKASTPPPKPECTFETCKTRRAELENELKQTRMEIKLRDDKMRQLEREKQSLQLYHSPPPDRDVLKSALAAMQDKNNQLEMSLSAETRLKLDLFSALGDAKRQMEIQQGLLIQKDRELSDLKSRVAEVMAFMPVSSSYLGRTSSPLAHLFSPPSPSLGYTLPQSLLEQSAKQQNSQMSSADGHSSPPPNSPFNKTPTNGLPPQ